MNALAALGITYLLITICSASILYYSFNGKIDSSGRYFFLGELTIIPGILGVVLINLDPIFMSPPPILFAINVCVWAAHVCVLFSISALSRNIKPTKYFLNTVPTSSPLIIFQFRNTICLYSNGFLLIMINSCTHHPTTQ